MENRMIAAGFGGQGVMMIGQLLCYAAAQFDKEALFYPVYGVQQRGGSANCNIILSDEPIGSPVSYQLDSLIAMNESGLASFQSMVRPGGHVYINSSQVDPSHVRADVDCVAVPVDDLAEKLGSSKVANIIMLGAFVKKSGFYTEEQILSAVCTKLAKKPQYLELNKAAVKCGMEEVKL